MSLQEFINKNKKELEGELRCGSCGNSLQQCGKYDIVKVGMGKGKRSEEGILCETCQKNNRKLVRVTRIIESPQTTIKQVANFLVKDLDTREQNDELEQLQKFKRTEVESITENKPTPVIDENAKVNEERAAKLAKERNNKEK